MVISTIDIWYFSRDFWSLTFDISLSEYTHPTTDHQWSATKNPTLSFKYRLFYIVCKMRHYFGLTCVRRQCLDALAMGSVTCVQAAPKSIILGGPLCIMSKKALTPTAALHWKHIHGCIILTLNNFTSLTKKQAYQKSGQWYKVHGKGLGKIAK